MLGNQHTNKMCVMHLLEAIHCRDSVEKNRWFTNKQKA